MKKSSYVYILSNKHVSVLYTGVTSNLVNRVTQHKEKQVEGFTKKYNINKLLYYEECPDILSAIEREKQVKDWRREKKITLIKVINPTFRDLSEDF
mgnify:CR=1 FL=1